MQGEEEYGTSDVAVNLAVTMRQEAIKLWSSRCHREAEVLWATHHVQQRSSSKVELVTRETSSRIMIYHEDEMRKPLDITEDVEAPVLTDATSNIDSLCSEGDDEIWTTSTVSKEEIREEVTLLQNETKRMWQFRDTVIAESHYHEQQQALMYSKDDYHHKTFEVEDHINQPSIRSDKGVEDMDASHKQDVVTSDSEESFHSLEDLAVDEQYEAVTDSGSECYDDAEKALIESTGVQTTGPEVCDFASQTVDIIISCSTACVQTDAPHLLVDASVNTVTMTTSNVSTNTTIVTADNAATNTVTMVTVDNSTYTDAVVLVDMETNTIPKTTNDAIIQTEKLLVSRSQSEYESLIDKYKKYIEALKSEVTQEKSQRLVAEQMVTIVQSDVENLRQRNIDLTSQQIKLENELSETKV